MNKILTALLASAFVATSAVAADDGLGGLDQDGNGAISAEEAAYSERLTQAWKQVDANEDGVVDRAEFSAFETMEPDRRRWSRRPKNKYCAGRGGPGPTATSPRFRRVSLSPRRLKEAFDRWVQPTVDVSQSRRSTREIDLL